MKVGKYLLEKHGFDKDSTKARFLEDFGYSEKILESILDDRYPCAEEAFQILTKNK
ncbi:hypothetical protein pETSU_252 [Edwardsiella phage pEt-SU]|uniref:Uncharacterized protein n=1 Tax=Edwardsiella phage pEt-SU TaxID=2562142 RepID=A0A4D6DWW7_9CAUD|nr:hypothetical protein HOV39_gp270 [Edwardsiella phage pEt-SU]QBZ70833.1 hypothetical protein pETSU_252 [Edwardsiella phage pEt-SU]